jgi:protocatechuate 4,5-dioxygenase, alpha chain
MGGSADTTVFTGELSQRGYRLNRFAMSLIQPANRARFREDEMAYMRAMSLSEAEIALVRARDWAGLVEAGGSIYLMIKIAGTVGQNLLAVGAQMRGETLESLMASLHGSKGQ